MNLFLGINRDSGIGTMQTVGGIFYVGIFCQCGFVQLFDPLTVDILVND